MNPIRITIKILSSSLITFFSSASSANPPVRCTLFVADQAIDQALFFEPNNPVHPQVQTLNSQITRRNFDVKRCWEEVGSLQVKVDCDPLNLHMVNYRIEDKELGRFDIWMGIDADPSVEIHSMENTSSITTLRAVKNGDPRVFTVTITKILSKPTAGWKMYWWNLRHGSFPMWLELQASQSHPLNVVGSPAEAPKNLNLNATDENGKYKITCSTVDN